MVSYDIIAYFLLGNIILYLLIHIPLDILTYMNKERKTKENTEEYSAWGEQQFIKIITLISSLVFWVFFAIWPILHLLHSDNFILFFNYTIPIVGEIIQYIGFVLIGLATIIAIIGRIARKRIAISWGVPKELTTNIGFQIVRHPLYASYCYYFLGFPLVMSNYLLIPLILGVIGYYNTAKYEEQILEKEFGEEYQAYQRKVGMLIPFIERKKE